MTQIDEEALEDALLAEPKNGEDWFDTVAGATGLTDEENRTLLRTAISAYLTALEAKGYVIEQGWQPIETAPEEIKDGRRVLGYGTIRGEHGYSDDHKAEFFMRWSTEIRRSKDGSVKRDSRWVIDQPTPRYFYGISVTHFALLQEPPK